VTGVAGDDRAADHRVAADSRLADGGLVDDRPVDAHVADHRLAALRPDRGAVLVIDVQRSFGDPAHLGDYGLDDDAHEAVAAAVERCADLVALARSAGVPVYWVELATPADEPWRASKWLRTGELDAPIGPDEPCVIGTPGAEWYGVVPADGEPRFGKRGYSGFLGTGLAERLTADGVEWVAVAGLTTECCVAATATDALQLGWPVVLAEDATAAYSAELHAAAVESLALNVAVIGDVETVAEVWAGAAGEASVAAPAESASDYGACGCEASATDSTGADAAGIGGVAGSSEASITAPAAGVGA